MVNGTVENEGGRITIEGIVERLHSSGGTAVVNGQVGSVSGSGPVTINAGAVLNGVPVAKTGKLP